VRVLIALLAALLTAAPAGAQDASKPIDVAAMGFDRGNPSAPITIIEFADFACSACGLFARETMPTLEREWIANGRARIKYIPFILGTFPRAMDAARSAECAAEQNAFWSMHDLLYTRQREWTGLGDARERFEAFARELKLDIARFRTCWQADRARGRIDGNTQVARLLQIRGTPTFFINGARIQGAIPADKISAYLETVAAAQR
jgi:protein-disulfide isomerase